MAGAARRQGGGRAAVRQYRAAPHCPIFHAEGVAGRVVIGELSTACVRRSSTASETLYADIRLEPGASVQIPADAEERAIYTLDGSVDDLWRPFPGRPSAGVPPGRRDRRLVPERGAHFMLFGGASLGSKRYIWWNFVSSSKERIEQAKEEWRTGRFDIVPGDEEEFIPLPEN